MAKKQGGLGRNFYSLLEDNQIMTENKAVERISLNKIEPRKDQPRKDFDQEALQALADSIAIHDVIQPIVVRDLGFNGAMFEDSYEIIAGERRWRAAKMAGLSDIPAVIITGDDLKVAQVSLIDRVLLQYDLKYLLNMDVELPPIHIELKYEYIPFEEARDAYLTAFRRLTSAV